VLPVKNRPTFTLWSMNISDFLLPSRVLIDREICHSMFDAARPAVRCASLYWLLVHINGLHSQRKNVSSFLALYQWNFYPVVVETRPSLYQMPYDRNKDEPLVDETELLEISLSQLCARSFGGRKRNKKPSRILTSYLIVFVTPPPKVFVTFHPVMTNDIQTTAVHQMMKKRRYRFYRKFVGRDNETQSPVRDDGQDSMYDTSEHADATQVFRYVTPHACANPSIDMGSVFLRCFEEPKRSLKFLQRSLKI